MCVCVFLSRLIHVGSKPKADEIFALKSDPRFLIDRTESELVNRLHDNKALNS